MIDFIIVGRGLAASVLMHTLHKKQVSFAVIGNEQLSKCSRVAAGIWNPVVFKRLTKSWLADEIVPFLNNFYSDCEVSLKKKLIHQRPIIKLFTEDHEKALWIKKSEKEMQDFVDPNIYAPNSPDLKYCRIDNDYGVVNRSGNLEVEQFLDSTALFFKEKIHTEVFDYRELRILPGKVSYKDIVAKSIIFCEGHLVKSNPWFNWLSLKPVKGEVITVKVPDLMLKDKIVNKNGFIMNVSDQTYKVGATYEWTDLEETPTQTGLLELKTKLRQLIACESTVIKHEAGVRPSSPDRRPIIGAHPQHPNVFIFNGLGTKGVMLAPFFAENFVNFYLQKDLLHKEVNVNRFYNLYEKK
jgi:glycine oxidase